MSRCAVVLILLCASSHQYSVFNQADTQDQHYWFHIGRQTLNRIMNKKIQNHLPKNIIVFIGDGMGVSTVTASGIYEGQQKGQTGEGNFLSFENFLSVGMSKTYNINKQVPDSASTATAMFTGVKTNHYTLGFDSKAAFNECVSDTNQRAVLTSMMTWAQQIGKSTGIVTTTRVTHATPAASYAHINNRDWECDSQIPAKYKSCTKDIARQLVEDLPGSAFKVILGGGSRQFGRKTEVVDEEDDSCGRSDNSDLVEKWLKNRDKSKFVSTADQLEGVDEKKLNYLMGLFSTGHLSYVGENVRTRPTLSLMTRKAINLLQKNDKGFVLLIEGGRIDQAHHKNFAHLALKETVEFSESVETALDLTSETDTLIIVTADHSHGFTINGYPSRGNNILGLAKNDSVAAYETLSYATGPGFRYHMIQNRSSVSDHCPTCSQNEKNSDNYWRDLRHDTTRVSNVHYQHKATIFQKDASHGGEDVAVYANGPLSHLLEGVYEQNYIGHVLSFALCSGPESHRCTESNRITNTSSSSPYHIQTSFHPILFIIIVYIHLFT